nr:zinc finger, CCHC-type [Tanacetum cinerariifolium]
MRGRSGQRDMEQGTDSVWSKSQERSNRLRCYICQSKEHLKRDCPRECRVRGTCKIPVQTRDGSSFVLNNVRQEQVIKGSLVVSSETRRANCVYAHNSQAVTMKTIKARKQLGEYQTRWMINTGTSSVQVLQGAEFQVEPQEDHKFEVESHGNVNHVVDLQEVQTQDLIYHHSARDKEQHLTWDLFSYKEDNNDDAFYGCYSGPKEYQVVWMRLDIASASVDMLNEFDYGLQTDVYGFVNFDYAMGRSITRYGLMIQGCAVSWEAKFQHMWVFSTTEAEYVTLTETVKEATWLKGLLTESETELKLVAVVATGAFIKAGPWFEIPA